MCNQASKETREAWKQFLKDVVKPNEPELYKCCVPECIYRGHCYEYESCGYHKTSEFKRRLDKYRERIND